MTPFRLVVALGALLATGGASYLGYYGIGRELGGIDRSVRAGSAGNTINASVK